MFVYLNLQSDRCEPHTVYLR